MQIKKALIFRPSSIGDALMGKYFLENIRAEYPSVRCGLVVGSRGDMVRDLFKAYPWIEVIEANRKSPYAFFILVKHFWRSDFVCTLYTGGILNLSTKLVARLFARVLVGYTDRSKLNRFLYTVLIPLIGRARAPRLLETDALEALSTPVSVIKPTFVYLPQSQMLEKFELEEKKYVVLHLFSGGNARGLSPEKRHVLIYALIKVLPEGMKLVLTGSDKERLSLGKDFPSAVISIRTSLQELSALIDHSALMVSLDTGAAHVAAHMGKPLIVLASCVGVQWWSPDMYGPRIPNALFTRLDVCTAGHDYSSYAKCLDAIDMREVARAARELVDIT